MLNIPVDAGVAVLPPCAVCTQKVPTRPSHVAQLRTGGGGFFVVGERAALRQCWRLVLPFFAFTVLELIGVGTVWKLQM